MAGVTGDPVRVEDQVTPRTRETAQEPAPKTGAQDPGFQVLDPFEVAHDDGSKESSTRVDDVHGLYHVAQLRDEIAAAAEVEGVHVALVLEDPYAESSKDNPGTLFVHPPLDARLVRKVLKAHQADEQYGMSDAQRAWPAIKEKIKADEDLSAEELRKALALMAERL